jgi:predicted enzyme related to lactoylglutathione lyase
MSQRDRYEPGVPCWVTTMQPDVEAAAEYYGAVFGWEYVDGGGFLTAQLRGRDVAAIAPIAPGFDPPPPPGWITQVSVKTAEGAAERVERAGGRVIAGPLEFDIGRMYVIADPAGAVLNAWEPRTRHGAQLVNEPGAWSMSRLDTADPEGAAAFYGEVFGWTTESFGPFTMFRLPGYVGGEPAQPVSREVVAVMAPAEEGARWFVDFWVDDVDAAVVRSEHGGGTTVQPPADGPVGRSAVVADPAGVAFSISHVVPPAG